MSIFIDCGTNEKQGLVQIASMNSDIDTVYSFEANTIVYDRIDKTDDVNYYNVAVSDKFGFCDFYLEKCIIRGDNFIGGGSRMQDPRYGLVENKLKILKSLFLICTLKQSSLQFVLSILSIT